MVADTQHPVGTESLQPLVISESAVAAVGDVAERSIGPAEYDDCAIDVTQLSNVVNDHIGAGGVHLDDFAKEEACQVEVMDGHVPEQSARGSEILARRWSRVTTHDGQLFKAADLASGDPIAPSRKDGSNGG